MKIEGPRETRKEDLSQVLELWNLIFRTSRGYPSVERLLFWNESNLGNMRILLVDDKPVTHVGIVERDAFVYGCKVKVGMIGGVCTHPDYQGRGYASTVLADAMRKMDEDGVDICMISGIRTLYDRVDSVIAGKGYRFNLGLNEAKRIRFLNVDASSYTENHLPDIIEAYDKEPVRIHRSIEDLKMLLSGFCQGSRGALILGS